MIRIARTQPKTDSSSVGKNINTENSDSARLSGFPPSRTNCGDSRSSAKFESDDATTASETMNSNVIKKRKSFARKSTTNNSKVSQNNNNSPDNPVENLRKQLEKLEDLGDQLPSNDTAYTLRYPFQDKGTLFIYKNRKEKLFFFLEINC